MLKKYSSLILLFLCSFSAMSQDVDSFRAEYEKFRKQAFSTYSDFRDECNQKYCEFLKSAWEYYQAGPIMQNPFKDDNKPPVIYEEDDTIKDDTPVPFDDVVPAPAPEPQPQPISPISPAPENDQLKVTINFFNTELAIRAPQSRIKLSSCNGEDLAKAWKTMSGSAYNPLLTDCLEVRSLMGLCDWAYLLFIWHLASTYLGENTNEATLLTAYIYSQSGYKMRLGEAEGHLCMLFASKHMIYGAPCYEIGQEYFYPLNYDGDGLNACNFAFDNEESMSLYITNEQKFTLLVGESRMLKAEGYPTSVNIAINESLVAFYSTYPTSEADNNFMTRWAMYANTPLDSEVKKQLYPALYSQLEGKTYPEAANILLDFVQSAFVYEYDDKVWGGDRAFFAEVANTQKGKSVLGTSSKISGANLYSRLNFWIVKCGGAALATPPTLMGVDAPGEAEVDYSADAFTFQLTEMPDGAENLKLVIMASAPQSNGVTKAYSKAVQIGAPREIVDAVIDIKADYEAAHGVPNAAAPKVFMKYFFVNAATGEKSGEMLVQATYAE